MALFIENVCCLEREGTLDRKVCDRTHVIGLNSHGTVSYQWRLGRHVKRGSMWSALDRCLYARLQKRSIAGSLGSSAGALNLIFGRSCAVCTIHALDRTARIPLLNFHPFTAFRM